MYQFIMEGEWFEKSGTKKKSDLNDNNKRGEGEGVLRRLVLSLLPTRFHTCLRLLKSPVLNTKNDIGEREREPEKKVSQTSPKRGER